VGRVGAFSWASRELFAAFGSIAPGGPVLPSSLSVQPSTHARPIPATTTVRPRSDNGMMQLLGINQQKQTLNCGNRLQRSPEMPLDQGSDLRTLSLYGSRPDWPRKRKLRRENAAIVAPKVEPQICRWRADPSTAVVIPGAGRSRTCDTRPNPAHVQRPRLRLASRRPRALHPPGCSRSGGSCRRGRRRRAAPRRPRP